MDGEDVPSAVAFESTCCRFDNAQTSRNGFGVVSPGVSEYDAAMHSLE